MKDSPRKAIVGVEELDVHTQSVPLSISGIISVVDAALRGLGNVTKVPDPTDRESLLAFSEHVYQAARSLTSAGERLHVLAARLEAAALIAYHRAPWPKPKASGRSRR